MPTNSTRPCSIDGCPRPHLARGWCFLHYSRWSKTGDPLLVIGRRPATPEQIVTRFWSHVPERPVDGCWEWAAGRHAAGYGKFKANGRTNLAHNFAWTLASGEPIPDDMDVLHACDNPPCVRNDEGGTYEVNGVIRPRFGHLWLGTDADNVADRDAKGRTASGERSGGALHPEQRRGERNGRAVLTLADVAEMRRLRHTTGASYRLLAAQFGVSKAQARRVVTGEQW